MHLLAIFFLSLFTVNIATHGSLDKPAEMLMSEVNKVVDIKQVNNTVSVKLLNKTVSFDVQPVDYSMMNQ